MDGAFPRCMKCKHGTMLPLSDYHHGGASMTYKAWACHNDECRAVLKIDKGWVSYEKASTHPRPERERQANEDRYTR